MASVSAVNVRRIAEEAGVSHITVSRALRGHANVAEATKARILEVAERLGYRSNPLVQAYAAHIRRGAAGAAGATNLAWLRSSPDGKAMHPWQRDFFEGAKMRAEALGFSLDSSINAHGLSNARLDQILDARGVRGVILPNLDYLDREPYQNPALVTVAIGESPAETPVHTVTPDYFKNLTAAMDRLLAYGYRRVGLCEHSFATVLNQGTQWGAYLFNQQRLEVARRVRPLVGLRVEGEHDPVVQRQFARWLDDERPDAIMVTFSQAKKWAEEAGYAVPGRLAVVHLGLSPDVREWSGLDFNDAVIGAAAVDVVTAHILRNEYGIPENPKLMRLGGHWVDGTTSIRPQGEIRAYLPASHSHSYEWFESEFFGSLEETKRKR